MAVSNKLSIVFTFFYLAVIIYLILFLTVPSIRIAIIESRANIAEITGGSNYVFIVIISFLICLVGNASVGFPVPYPFVLLSFSNAIYSNFLSQGLILNEILMNGIFWLEILGIALSGGLGSALGESVSLLVGKGVKKVAEKTSGDTLIFAISNLSSAMMSPSFHFIDSLFFSTHR